MLNYCSKCGWHWATHNEDGSCVQEHEPCCQCVSKNWCKDTFPDCQKDYIDRPARYIAGSRA